MNRKLYGIVAGIVLFTTAITGCATSKTTSVNVTNTTVKTPVAAAQLTKSKITKQLEQQEGNHVLSNIQVITLKNVGSRAYAFVSFDEDGKMKYANVIHLSSEGTGMGIFSAPNVKGHSIQADQQVGKDGYNLITGVVVNNPNVKNVVITFANGSVKQVPVQNGQFLFFGQIGTSESDAYLKNMIGVSNHGEIVVNKS